MRSKRITAVFFLCIIICLLCLSSVSYATKKFTDLFVEKGTAPSLTIDWEALYPFNASENIHNGEVRVWSSKNLYTFIKNGCETYTSKELLGYRTIVEIARTYEELIGWNLARIIEYNGAVKLRDGYLTQFTSRRDIVPSGQAVTEFARYCQNRGIGFFYGNLPSKVCVYDDTDVSGELDFANQNADEFLELLARNGIKYYDFRKMLHDDGMKHHEAFFRTDQHWKPETGLWAAKRILQILRDDYSWEVTPEILDPDNFEYVIYPEWFLGSFGKKVTLSRAKPEDITMIYPKYQTYIRCEVPAKSLDITGDFSITYDMSQVESKDYYTRSPYHAYAYGDQALMRIYNSLASNNRRFLLIHDSFSDVVIPFLAMGIRLTEAIDLRFFSGSIKNFIEQHKPDVVAVLYTSYHPGIKKQKGWQQSFYSFR